MRDAKDSKALLDAMLAIDSAVQSLVVARIMLEDRYAEDMPPAEAERPQEADSDSEVVLGCQHVNLVAVDALGGSQQLCVDCGENFGADS